MRSRAPASRRGRIAWRGRAPRRAVAQRIVGAAIARGAARRRLAPSFGPDRVDAPAARRTASRTITCRHDSHLACASTSAGRGHAAQREAAPALSPWRATPAGDAATGAPTRSAESMQRIVRARAARESTTTIQSLVQRAASRAGPRVVHPRRRDCLQAGPAVPHGDAARSVSAARTPEPRPDRRGAAATSTRGARTRRRAFATGHDAPRFR